METTFVAAPSGPAPLTIRVRPSVKATDAPFPNGLSAAPTPTHVPTAWGDCASSSPEPAAARTTNTLRARRRVVNIACLSTLGRDEGSYRFPRSAEGAWAKLMPQLSRGPDLRFWADRCSTIR